MSGHGKTGPAAAMPEVYGCEGEEELQEERQVKPQLRPSPRP